MPNSWSSVLSVSPFLSLSLTQKSTIEMHVSNLSKYFNIKPTNQLQLQQMKWTLRRGRCVCVCMHARTHAPHTLTFNITNVFQPLPPSGGRLKVLSIMESTDSPVALTKQTREQRKTSEVVPWGPTLTGWFSTAWPDIYLQGPWSTLRFYFLNSKM